MSARRRLSSLAGLVAAGLAATCAPGSGIKGELRPVEDVSLQQVDQALGAKRLALVVGIDRFADDRWPALKHATEDATALGALLADPQRGRFDSVEVLADPGGETRDTVLAAIDRLATRNLTSRDTVVIYFSTHGTLARGPGGQLARYLVTTDSDLDHIPATALRVSELLERFESLPSERKLLVLASCHSGAGKSVLPPRVAAELTGTKGAFFVRPLSETSQASVVLTACAWGETAREDDALGHDIYTNFLLEALAGKDADGDGAVTATEAHAYAMAQTYYFSHGRQRPQVESRVLGADPIVLSGRRLRPGDPVLFSFLPRYAGLKVRVDGRDKGELPARLVLEPGSHRVVVCEPEACGGPGQEGAPLVDERVELEPGEALAVESMVDESRPAWSLEARAGYQRFFDPLTRRELVRPLAAYSLSLTRERFPLDMLETSLDLTLTGADQDLDVGGLSIARKLLQISYGLTMQFRFDLGPLALLLGPRLAGIHLIRFGANPDGSDQHFANFSPGFSARLRWQLDLGLSFGLEARIHYLSVHMPSGQRDTAYLDLFGGLGWAF